MIDFNNFIIDRDSLIIIMIIIWLPFIIHQILAFPFLILVFICEMLKTNKLNKSMEKYKKFLDKILPQRLFDIMYGITYLISFILVIFSFLGFSIK